MPLTPSPRPASDDLGTALDSLLLGRDDGRPAPQRSVALRARLLESITADARPVSGAGSPASSPRAPRRTRWLAAAAVGAVLVTGAAIIPGAAAEAHAEQVLTATARGLIQAQDLPLGADQYLKVEYHHRQLFVPPGTSGADVATKRGFVRYFPSDPQRNTVEVPLAPTMGDGSVGTPRPSESFRGDAMGAHGLPHRLGLSTLDEIPRETDAVLGFFRDRYTGGSVSPEEDLFVQITDVLSEPGLPADLRSALVSALAQVHGARVDEGVELSDGRHGVGVSRAEPLRAGSVQQIVLDPTTGQVIGERHLAGVNLGELRVGSVMSESLTHVEVVDAAPEAEIHRDLMLLPDGTFIDAEEYRQLRGDISHLP